MSCRQVQRECDELLYTGSVARYGPQSVASAMTVGLKTVDLYKIYSKDVEMRK